MNARMITRVFTTNGNCRNRKSISKQPHLISFNIKLKCYSTYDWTRANNSWSPYPTNPDPTSSLKGFFEFKGISKKWLKPTLHSTILRNHENTTCMFRWRVPWLWPEWENLIVSSLPTGSPSKIYEILLSYNTIPWNKEKRGKEKT